jgi:hypothetical protein
MLGQAAVLVLVENGVVVHISEQQLVRLFALLEALRARFNSLDRGFLQQVVGRSKPTAYASAVCQLAGASRRKGWRAAGAHDSKGRELISDFDLGAATFSWTMRRYFSAFACAALVSSGEIMMRVD